MTDSEKHERARKMGYPHAVFLPQSLYELAERSGINMDFYVIQKPIALPQHQRV